jgi:hypothetical protein
MAEINPLPKQGPYRAPSHPQNSTLIPPEVSERLYYLLIPFFKNNYTNT